VIFKLLLVTFINTDFYPSTDLAQLHGTLFGFYRLFHCFHIFFMISNFFELSITKETKLVEMCIWCIKIGIVLVYVYSLICIPYKTYEIDYWSLFLSFH
jgi:cbb3-type cytochrome oxidase subunit 1